MDLILNKDVQNLGKAGEVVKVKDGFAHNFLIPGGFAVPSTPANLKRVEQEKQKKQIASDKVKNECEALKEKLASLSLTLPVLTQENDILYGSIGPVEIVSALQEEGLTINKDAIVLDEHIKALGIYEVSVKLHPEVQASVKIWVVKK